VLCYCCKQKVKKQNIEQTLLFKDILLKVLGLDFISLIKEDVEHNILKHIYYYNGGGVSVGDINNDGLPDVYFVSNMGENKLYLN